jgi:hypothetical protein
MVLAVSTACRRFLPCAAAVVKEVVDMLAAQVQRHRKLPLNFAVTMETFFHLTFPSRKSR